MDSSSKEEIEKFLGIWKTYGARTLHALLAAVLIWLFGILVFIPLASSINWQAKAVCTLIFFVAFSLPVLKSLPALKRLIDTFSSFPARKYGVRKGLNYENSLIMFRHVFYIVSGLILYLLYLPFLANFHPAISGIVLILVLIWIFFLTLRILSVLSQKIAGWLFD
jgi:hypothetical protein